MDWVRPSGHEEALRAYNDWVFGPAPVTRNRNGNPLFVSGTIAKGAAAAKERNEAHTIKTGSLIIVHVIGTNFIADDQGPKGSGRIDTDERIREFCRHGAQDEDKLDYYVLFKAKDDADWTNLNAGVEEVNMTPVWFKADPNNPYLDKWDVKMPQGKHRGAWSSKVLLMRIPVVGAFEIKSHGTSINDYEQNTHFQIKVKKH